MKRIAAFITISVISAGLLGFLSLLTSPKYMKGITEGALTAEYYEDKAPHEVIILGDCEVYENISTLELYKKYGISSYIRGNARQLTNQSYYLLEDTLRYETPKAVVFNVCAIQYEDNRNENYNRMTIDGMKWSKAKIDMIRSSMTGDESFISYVFPFLRFHSRWSGLKPSDFEYLFKRDRISVAGYYLRADTRPAGDFPSPKTLTEYDLPARSMEYLDKMAALCREKNIELILIKAPIEYPHWYDEWDEAVSNWAAANNVRYFNMLKADTGLDMQTDTYDAGLHLNVKGAEKTADILGDYLTKNAGLTDFRKDHEVSRIWQDNERFYNEIKDRQLREIEEYGELMSFGKNAIE